MSNCTTSDEMQNKLVRNLKSLPPVVKTSGNFNAFKGRSPLPPKTHAHT